MAGMIMVNPFMKRGLHGLTIDGPGQGVCNLCKIRVCPNDHEEAGKAHIDYLMNRPKVDVYKLVYVWGKHWVILGVIYCCL